MAKCAKAFLRNNGIAQSFSQGMRRRFLHEGCLEPGKPSGLSRGMPKPSSEHADGKILLLCPEPVNAHFWCSPEIILGCSVPIAAGRIVESPAWKCRGSCGR